MAFGSLFSMCQGGPVPKGCCSHGDRLDVVMTDIDTQLDWLGECQDWGGRPVVHDGIITVDVCEDVDF